jgi:hypothetical protein
MKHIKKIISEAAGPIFTLAPTDPWEYQYDPDAAGLGEWWTRKKGTTEWFDMKRMLKDKPGRYELAVSRLEKSGLNKPTTSSPNTDNTTSITPSPETQSANIRQSQKATPLTFATTQNYTLLHNSGTGSDTFTHTEKLSVPAGTKIYYYSTHAIFYVDHGTNISTKPFRILYKYNTNKFINTSLSKSSDGTYNEPVYRNSNFAAFLNTLQERYKLLQIDDTTQKEFDLTVKIANDLYNVLTKNPEKYFKKFRSILNDKEDAAADWLRNAFNNAWGADLQKLLSSKSPSIQSNAKIINYWASYAVNSMSMRSWSGTMIIKHPVSAEKNKTFNLKFNYFAY